VSGTAITLAGRLKEAAPPGEILVAHDTYTHVRGVFDVRQLPPVRMRGRNEPVEVYVVLRARPRAFRQQARGIEGIETKMIGREPELKVLQDAMGLTIEDRETQVVTVVGEAGVGKSRLLYEFTNWVDLMEEKLWFFEARATQPSMLQPYSLTRDLFSFRFKILDNDPLSAVHEKFEAGIASFLNGGGSRETAHMIGQLVGFDFSESPVVKPKLEEPEAFHQEALALLGKFFLAAAGTSPVFIQVEDIHWADDRSLDLLNSLARENTAIPLFIIYMARPQLYDRRPSWGEGQGFHARINLQPLSRLDSRRLVRELLKKVDQVPTELRDLIIDRAEGNPFYMEELVKALIDDGVIVKGEDSWQVQQEKFSAVRVPPTLVGVLQSRLDSFPPGQRTLLQRASVVGRIFWESAVVHLSAADGVTAGAVGGMLEDLREREMVFKREESAFEGTPEYGFRHAILRDVVYETIVPSQRRGYHRLVAEWLTEAGRDRLEEYNPLIADHYERAEASPQAAEHLRRVAARASVVGSLDEAIRIQQRAVGMLSEVVSPIRMHLQIDLGSALAVKGSYDVALAELESGLEAARSLGERSAEAKALAELGRVVGVWRGDIQAGQTYFDEALPIARELKDRPALVFITRQLGNLSNSLGELDKARAHLEESLALAREIGDRGAEVNALNSLGNTLQGQDDFDGALRYYQEGLDLAAEIGDRGQRAMLTGNMAQVPEGRLHLGQAAVGARAGPGQGSGQRLPDSRRPVGDRDGPGPARRTGAGPAADAGGVAHGGGDGFGCGEAVRPPGVRQAVGHRRKSRERSGVDRPDAAPSDQQLRRPARRRPGSLRDPRRPERGRSAGGLTARRQVGPGRGDQELAGGNLERPRRRPRKSAPDSLRCSQSCASAARSSSCTRPLVATRESAPTSTCSLPRKSVARPPASCTNRTPAAQSQGLSRNSQYPSKRPAAT